MLNVSSRPSSVLRPLSSALWLLPFAWLWFGLINHLRIEWAVNPQYAYGWAVPFLCVYLLWKRTTRQRDDETTRRKEAATTASVVSRPVVLWSLALCAFLYLPTRLIQEANPEWRLVSWALALEVVGLTLLLLHLRFTIYDSRFAARSSPASVLHPWPVKWPRLFHRAPISNLPSSLFDLRNIAFPICFFLVAVPWPTFVEGPLIQKLTRANVAATIEILSWFSVPAIQHGNVIEVATGLVGIDDACSGIRSFQATLMISLFLGELYALSAVRRALLVLAGFAFSFIFNVGRTGLLTWVAARDGVPAISKWHDPAGIIILVGCFMALWLIAVALRKSSPIDSGLTLTPNLNPNLIPPPATFDVGCSMLEFPCGILAAIPRGGECSPKPAPCHLPSSIFHLLALPLALCAWLIVVEVGTELWYRWHERGLGTPVEWAVQWPKDRLGYKELPFSENTRQFLRYDHGKNVQWQDGAAVWQVIYLRWNAGHITAHLVRGHTPEVCLTAAGHQVETLPEMTAVTEQGMRLPFRVYSFPTERGPVFVFYCLWEDRRREQAFDTESLSYKNRFSAIRAGRRNLGQRSLEVAIWGLPDAARAQAALEEQLAKIIVVEQGREGKMGQGL